eukprot:TRINITY_DN3382_c2_g1_i1.p1 TRINITY_DN3382_c2_g1~~TRINITY_DN3382_c2_g1_i1.p1  ORF type:complete len:314 (+),score=119.08 TRINITY_DN3382_c2_g1_i1:75-1016(+)
MPKTLSPTELARWKGLLPKLKNRMRKSQIYKKVKQSEKYIKKQKKIESNKIAKELGKKVEKQVPLTIEKLKVPDETEVKPEDDEVLADLASDEFSRYFSGKTPKVLITTSLKPRKSLIEFVSDLIAVFPNSFYLKRTEKNISRIIKFAKKNKYTDVIVVHQDKTISGLIVIHLPYGPTAFFKLTNVVQAKRIEGRAFPSSHFPELILNNFNSRLGHLIGRMFASLFPQRPQFSGRRVVTFHNQRDYIFFHHDRYLISKAEQRQRLDIELQEIGPAFTMKLKSIQKGLFDPVNAEYIWIRRKETLPNSRKRFFL